MPRFTETVDIRQAQNIQGGGNSLANRLTSFADQQTNVHAQNVARNEFAKGQAAFQSGDKPEFKEAKFFGKVGAEAYNQGLRTSYVSSVDRDNREEVARRTAENPSNLTGYNDAVESYRKTILKNVDPSARQVIGDSLDGLISSNRIRVQTNEVERTHKENDFETASHVDSATNDALSFAREGDKTASGESALAAFATIDGRISAGFITAEQGAVQKRSIERGLVEEGLRGELFKTFDDSGAQASMDALDDLSEKVPRGFAPDEWDSFVSKTQTDLNRKEARQKQQGKENLKAEALDNSIKRGFLFTNPDVPADPVKGGQDRKDINNYYESVSPSWTGSGNEIINQNVDFVKNTGLVPKQLITNMGASMRSGNVGQVTTMTEVMQRLQEESPSSVRDFDSESKAMAVQVSDAVRNGMEPELAVEAARKNTFGLTPTQKQEIKSTISGKQRVERISNFESMVSDEFDPNQIPVFGMFSNEPDIPVGMQAEYMSSFENFMAITGSNVEQSEKLAFEATKNIWGVSNVGGDTRFMRGAPESFYHVDGFNDTWIDDQFISDTVEMGIPDAIIGTDAEVFRSGNQPSYPIMAPNKDGILDIIEDDDGKPLRFQPNLKLTDEYQELVNAPGKQIESAKKARERKIGARARKIQGFVNADLFRMKPAGAAFLPAEARSEYVSSDEGKEIIRASINKNLANGRIDQIEAEEALKGYSAGTLKDLSGYDVFVRIGKIDADNQ